MRGIRGGRLSVKGGPRTCASSLLRLLRRRLGTYKVNSLLITLFVCMCGRLRRLALLLLCYSVVVWGFVVTSCRMKLPRLLKIGTTVRSLRRWV